MRVWRSTGRARVTVHDLQMIVDPGPTWQLEGRWIWRLGVHPRMTLFLWRVAWGILPTKGILAGRGIPIPADCEGCPGKEETISHVLFMCPRALQVWGLVLTHRLTFTSTEIFLSQLRDSARIFDTMDRATVWAYVAYHIWLDRNARIFEGRGFYPRSVVGRALAHAAELASAAADITPGDDRDI
ncbi:uncharacterized protein LOC120106228 [Phoenix dactylifera]|uniref:Uncharacterized protein LOC120106228 n=1 Tax=Phoenix dactylifera TaxID=42345 RepID=A0A8B8ZP32_PHODC|nr:uncharacterized protein LOC120106228 [Phoenix dactylifera]